MEHQLCGKICRAHVQVKSATTLRETPVPLCIHAVIQTANHASTVKCIKSCRSRTSVKTSNISTGESDCRTAVGIGKATVSVLELIQNGSETKKHSVDGNPLLDERGQSSCKLTGRLQRLKKPRNIAEMSRKACHSTLIVQKLEATFACCIAFLWLHWARALQNRIV